MSRNKLGQSVKKQTCLKWSDVTSTDKKTTNKSCKICASCLLPNVADFTVCASVLTQLIYCMEMLNQCVEVLDGDKHGI